MVKFILILLFFGTFAVRAFPDLAISSDSEYYPYYQLINRAKSLAFLSNHTDADMYYERAFNVVKRPFKFDCLDAFENAYHFDKTKALNYLKRACDLGITYSTLKSNSTFLQLIKSDKKLIKEHLSNVVIHRDEDLYKTIQKMVKEDQKARVFWTDWLKWEKQVKIMDKVDRPHAIQLLEMANKDGFPGFSKLGEDFEDRYWVDGVSLMILHFSKEELAPLFPYMVKAVEKGEMYPYHLGRCVDYVYMGTESDSADYRVLTVQQQYGTNFSGTELIPFGTVESVNEARAKIGLEPIEIYAAHRKLTLPSQLFIRYTAPK